MGMADFFVYVVMTCSITVSFTAVYTLLGSLFSNKAMAVVYTIFCFFLLAIASSGFYDRLAEPEFNQGMMLVGSELVMMEPTANPLYLSGTSRLICECAMEFLPSGQALLLSDVSIENPVRAIFLGAVFTVIVMNVGCVLFRKRDIK